MRRGREEILNNNSSKTHKHLCINARTQTHAHGMVKICDYIIILASKHVPLCVCVRYVFCAFRTLILQDKTANLLYIENRKLLETGNSREI